MTVSFCMASGLTYDSHAEATNNGKEISKLSTNWKIYMASGIILDACAEAMNMLTMIDFSTDKINQ